VVSDHERAYVLGVRQTTTTTRSVEAATLAAERSTSTGDLFEAVGAEVAKVVPHDGAMWFALDPSTGFAAAPARFENLDDGFCSVFWHHEFHDHDATLFRDMIRDGVTAASLRAATDDRPMRSVRWREFLRPQGYDDEVRIVFRTGDSAWAVGALMRDAGRPSFDEVEIDLLARMSAAVSPILRTQAAAVGSGPVLGSASAPGLLLFSADGELLSANPEAEHWLDEVCGPPTDTAVGWSTMLAHPFRRDLDVPTALTALLASARAVAEGVEPGPCRLRLRTWSGRWLVLHASTLGAPAGATDDSGAIAVVIEPATSSDIAPIIIEAYGLSPREREVVRAIARGSSTPEIASSLFLSPHTVRDHVKAVFEKVGVSSRGELVAKLFAEHYTDPFHADAAHVG
jgi:DNA-binding CsgD family transcriptional regulator